MATVLPRQRADFRPLTGLLFAIWALVVLAAYFSYHPLPMRAGVPVGKGILTVVGMLVISWPLWRHADPRRGPQVEHLLLLPILLTAALVMLPHTPAMIGVVLCLFWIYPAMRLRQLWGTTGFLLALLIWFPGFFAPISVMRGTAVMFAVMLLIPIMLFVHRDGNPPHRYVRRAAVVALAIGVLLSLADIQRRYHPVGYLTGIVDEQTWLAQNCVENPYKRGDWTLRR